MEMASPPDTPTDASITIATGLPPSCRSERLDPLRQKQSRCRACWETHPCLALDEMTWSSAPGNLEMELDHKFIVYKSS